MEGSPLKLSPRERDVLELLAEGHDVRSIAAALTVSPATVRTHLRGAHTRLGARSRPHAVALALVRGLIDPRTRLDAAASGEWQSAPWTPAAAAMHRSRRGE